MKPIEIHFHSTGSSGNIFFILGAVRNAMMKRRQITAYNNLRDEVMNAGSYAEALSIIRKQINLIDDDGKV